MKKVATSFLAICFLRLVVISKVYRKGLFRQPQATQEVKEFRFAKGKICPHCSAETVSRNGKYKGKQ